MEMDKKQVYQEEKAIQMKTKKSECQRQLAEKSAYERLLAKIIKAKEAKFGLRYDVESEEYKSFCLYRSTSIDTYGQYKHYASFYGYKLLSKAELFKWYQMFFEVRTDCIFAQDAAPTKEGFLKGLDFESSKWTKAELKSLRDYVNNEVMESSEAYYKHYKVKKNK